MTNSPQSRLMAAIEDGDEPAITGLLADGADVNQPSHDPDGETPLIRAVRAGRASVVKLLLASGARVEQRQSSAKAWTPLLFASSDAAIARELIVAGADVHARTPAREVRTPLGGRKRLGGETALHLAARANNPETIQLLVAAGAEVEALAEDGGAPLDYALRLGTVNEAAEALVAAGAQLTPERLELMHSDAFRPDADVPYSSFVAEVANPAESGSGASGTREHPPEPQALERPSEFKCPTCGALLYSRKPKLCGKCGALLPRELVLSDADAEALRDQRQWARELADGFGSPGSSPSRRAAAVGGAEPVRKQKTAEDALELVRRLSFAAEFKQRDRPDFWLYMLGYGLVFGLGVLIFIQFGGLAGSGRISPAIFLVLLGSLAFHGLRAWNYASPICPHCHCNVRYCVAEYCHICGKQLSHRRCAECSVDDSWLSFVKPLGNSGNYGWIVHCPGCGVYLDTKVRRWRASRRD